MIADPLLRRGRGKEGQGLIAPARSSLAPAVSRPAPALSGAGGRGCSGATLADALAEMCIYADDVDDAIGERMAYVEDPDGNPVMITAPVDAG